jgi:hypothetical protein
MPSQDAHGSWMSAWSIVNDGKPDSVFLFIDGMVHATVLLGGDSQMTRLQINQYFGISNNHF